MVTAHILVSLLRAFIFCPLSLMLAIDLSHRDYITLRKIFLFSVGLFYKIMNVRLSQKKILCMYCDDHLTFVFAFNTVVYYFYGFAYVEPSLNSWVELQLIIIYSLPDVLMHSIYRHLIMFASVFIRELALVGSFSVVSS